MRHDESKLTTQDSKLLSLLRLDLRRVADSFRHPSGSWIGIGLPLVLVAGLLWGVGRAGAPSVEGVGEAVTLGFLVAGPLAFAGYGTLFGGSDAAFLRRLGVPARALFRERALRLLLLALAWAGLALLPFAAAGVPLARPAVLALSAALAGWGIGLAALSGAARGVAAKRKEEGWGLLALGMWDMELAAIAPLVHAPLLPLLAGGFAAGVVGAAQGAAWGRAALVAALAAIAARVAEGWFAGALPRFAPRALEMSFVTPPSAAGELVVGRGAARLFPRRAAAAWARDAVVAGRRFAWASRLAWPVSIAALVGLARWGEQPGTRAWIAAAALLALLAQGAAGIGLGRLERGGRRWIDRAVGIGWPHRLLGRWGWGTGVSLWLTVPLALAWSWWGGVGPGWPWIAAGASVAAVSAAASLVVSGWR